MTQPALQFPSALTLNLKAAETITRDDSADVLL
jgi:hypothetical protein